MKSCRSSLSCRSHYWSTGQRPGCRRVEYSFAHVQMPQRENAAIEGLELQPRIKERTRYTSRGVVKSVCELAACSTAALGPLTRWPSTRRSVATDVGRHLRFFSSRVLFEFSRSSSSNRGYYRYLMPNSSQSTPSHPKEMVTSDNTNSIVVVVVVVVVAVVVVGVVTSVLATIKLA